MFVVTKTHSFDPETEASTFTSWDEAVSYLQRMWEDYFNEEIANDSDLDESECYHEDDFAQIGWSDGCRTWFHLIEITPPREDIVQKAMVK